MRNPKNIVVGRIQPTPPATALDAQPPRTLQKHRKRRSSGPRMSIVHVRTRHHADGGVKRDEIRRRITRGRRCRIRMPASVWSRP